MSDVYDKSGRPLSNEEYIRRLSDPDYKRVASTRLYGRWVSTVWLGLDHNFGYGPPLIFESMLFAGRDWMDLDCQRYETLSEAERGHRQMVAKHLPRWRHRLAVALGVGAVLGALALMAVLT